MTDQLASSCVSTSQTLLDAFAAIERSHAGIAFVLDDDQRLIGTLTDGDIRRRLIGGGSLQDTTGSVVKKDFTFVGPEVGRVSVLDLMQARLINQVPIVSDQGHLIGLHLLHEIIGTPERSNWAVIMAGGKGVRLRPITEHIPKPMVKVAGRPMIEQLVLHLVGAGFRKIFISVNYLAHIIQDHFQDGARFGCSISYLHETEELGTAGSISLLHEKPTAPVVVLNGDLVTEVNFGDLLRFHETGGYSATVAAKVHSYEFPYGCLSLDDSGTRVQGIEEKPLIQRLVNAGIYVLSPETVSLVPPAKYLMTELLENALQHGQTVGAYPMNEEWLDVGYRDQLLKANGR